MKSYATILLAGAAAVSAAVLPREESSTGSWSISDFSFSGVRMSAYEFYRLTVNDGSESISCSTSTSIGPNPQIASFDYTPCGTNDWSFGFFYVDRTNPEPGYSLQVTREVPATSGSSAYNQTGCIFIGQSHIKTYSDSQPFTSYQYVDWPADFQLDWTTGQCIYN